MPIWRVLGSALVVVAIGAAGHEIFLWLQSGAYRTFAFGEMWAAIHLGSLNLFQVLIQRHISPWLWAEVVLPVLLAPAWLVLILPGGVLCFGPRIGRFSRRRS